MATIKHNDTTYVTTEMSRNDILDLMLELQEEMASIEIQIKDAQAKKHTTGEYTDPEWYSRATTARKIKALQVKRLQTELSKRKKSKLQGIETKFVDVAKEVLSSDLFAGIMSVAKERVENDTDSA